MCGLPVIDLQDWQRHTDYTGEFERKAGSHKVRAPVRVTLTSGLSGSERGGGSRHGCCCR